MEPITNRIGKICRSMREGYEITQDDMALCTGYSRSNIAAFEQGRNNNLCIFLEYMRKFDGWEMIKDEINSEKYSATGL